MAIETKQSEAQNLTTDQSLAWLEIAREIFGTDATAASVAGVHFKRRAAGGPIKGALTLKQSGTAEDFRAAFLAGYDGLVLNAWDGATAEWIETRVVNGLELTPAMIDLVQEVHPSAPYAQVRTLQLLRGEGTEPNRSALIWIGELTVEEWIETIPIAGSDSGIGG